jgi:hypothetical protein
MPYTKCYSGNKNPLNSTSSTKPVPIIKKQERTIMVIENAGFNPAKKM